uniref:RAB6-interacting golgin n=1 Tax=Heterorhabditis bacteriophora TaxID=37862 RepID=A0A1I7XB51_HETBA
MFEADLVMTFLIKHHVRSPANKADQQFPLMVAPSQSDSEDEEVLFTKDMVRRLNQKAKDFTSTSRPASSLSDISAVSTISGASSMQKMDTIQAENKNKLSQFTIMETDQRPRVTRGDEGLITPRTREMVLDEIREFEQEKPLEDKKASSKKKYYFRKRMLEINNTTRILESKKEEAVWKEQYDLANDIEKCLTKLRTSEAPLKELIMKRVDALEENDYLEAQR